MPGLYSFIVRPPDYGNKITFWAALRRPSRHVLASHTGERFSSQTYTQIFHFGHKHASSFYLQIARGSGNDCKLAWLWLKSHIRPEEWRDNEPFTIVLGVPANSLVFLESATVLILTISLYTQCLHHLSVTQMPCRAQVWVNLNNALGVGKSS